MEKIELSIIIPTYNRKDLIKRVLIAINNQDYDLTKIEVLVIDDHSQFSPKTEISKLNTKYKLRFFRLKNNSGQGKVRNYGLKLAKGKFVLFLGDDMIPENNLLREHMELHKLNKGIAVLGKVVWEPELRNKFMNFIEKIQFHYHTIKDRRNVKLHFYTSNVSLEKKWFKNEGYAPEFKNYGLEDLELGYRLENNGLIVMYNENAIVRHVHSYTFEQFCGRMRNVGKSAVIFVRLHPELKRRYIPRMLPLFKLGSFILSRSFFKIISKKLYWYSNFVYNYILGIEEER